MRFEGWGEEDVDIAVRLRRIGLRCGHAGPDGTLIHLSHESDIPVERPNWHLLQTTEGSDRVEAVEGLRELRGPRSTMGETGLLPRSRSSSAERPARPLSEGLRLMGRYAPREEAQRSEAGSPGSGRIPPRPTGRASAAFARSIRARSGTGINPVRTPRLRRWRPSRLSSAHSTSPSISSRMSKTRFASACRGTRARHLVRHVPPVMTRVSTRAPSIDETDPDRPSAADADPVERQLELGTHPDGNAADCHGEHGSRTSRPDSAGVGKPPSRPEPAEVLQVVEPCSLCRREASGTRSGP